MDFQGAQSEYTKNYTGLVDVSLLAFNPEKADFLRLTGNELPYEPKYQGTDSKGRPFTTLAFLCHVPGTDIYPVVNIMVQDIQEESKNGKFKFYDPTSGYYSYFVPTLEELVTKIQDNPKMDWINVDALEPLKVGKEKINTFVQKLIKFNPRAKDTDWEGDFEKNFGSWEDICAGKHGGFNALVDYAQSHENKVRILLGVRKTEKKQDDGTVKTYYNQDVITNPIVFAREGNTTPSKYTKVAEEVQRAQAAGANFSNKLFTLEFQEFVEEECINYTPAPDETVAQPENQQKIDW